LLPAYPAPSWILDDLPGAKLQSETQSRVSRRLQLRLAVLFRAASLGVAISQIIEIIHFLPPGVRFEA
jgi:hypothetical protein